MNGVYIIEMELFPDERGFFTRSFCKKEFANHGLVSEFVQCNVSNNKKKGTLRGMHYQESPFEETKLVRCTRGSIYDVVVDIRPQSSTYKEWISCELTEYNHKMLYIPAGYAHGFQTLTDDVDVFYQMSQYYHPNSARGIRWDDPAFSVKWPMPAEIISQKDQSYGWWSS